MENTKEKEITLKTLFEVLKKSYIVMIIAAIVLASAAAAFVALLVKPSYVAEISFWVYTSSTEHGYTSQAQTSAATAIASSCVELVNEDLPVRTAVQYAELDKKFGFETENDCVKYVRKMISAEKDSQGSFIFRITVRGDNGDHVLEVTKALNTVMPDVMKELIVLAENEDTSPILKQISAPNEVKTVKTSAVKTFVLVAAVVAMLVYLVYFIISIFDTVVYSAETVRENFDKPLLGTIPTWANGNESKKRIRSKKSHGAISSRDYEKRLLTADAPFGVTEAFNQLRTNIIYSSASKGCSVIAVTSAQSGDGKSLLCANLSASLSALGKRVLLVEADMRCPVLCKVFSTNAGSGLSELLAGIVDGTASVTNRAPIGDFDVIYSGKIPPNPSELLSSQTMRDVVAAWRESYDFVIIDMPPIGEVIDAGVVADIIDGYAVTVRCEISDINEVRRAVESIESVNGKVFGFVLNDYNPKATTKYKKHYYGPEAKYARAELDN